MSPTPRSAWIPVYLNHVGSATATVYAAPGKAGTIKQITVGAPVVAGAGTLALAKGATNILTAESVNLADDIVGGTAEDLVLATSGATLEVLATDILSAVWTIDTATSYVGGAVTIWLEPFTW